MLQKFIIFFLCIYAVILFSGCATVIHGTTQKIAITTNPPGATVTADGLSTIYITPTKIKLKRKEDHDLLITKESFEIEQIHIHHVLSGAVAGNIIAGGLIGWGVDATSGAQYRLVPDNINLTLRTVSIGSSYPREKTLEDRLKEIDSLKEKKLINDSEYEQLRKKILESQIK
jgi:hypothetical protein